MGRDKARDDTYFNCEQEWEISYVANLYGENKDNVRRSLEKWCREGKLKYSTHMQVYQLIKRELGLEIPG